MKRIDLVKKTRIVMLVMTASIIVGQSSCYAQQKKKPRILISTDIGGTDPDDNQSMIHLFMYSNLFNIEGLVSSPSFGEGSKEEILRMIDFYQKDIPKLQKHEAGFPTAEALRSICKQGRKGAAPYKGYSTATEGSDWIVKCAKKKSDQPLWVLVWGGIEDVAQALHDAPEIKKNIRVYWIGGPNKKWGVNAYAYIVENHPDLWMIENNATYRGWFVDKESPENVKGNIYYTNFIKGFGEMGKDFINYYKGVPKMGDTPSLAYLMDGDANDPTGESWGGSFVKINRSSRNIFTRNTTLADTVATYGVIEWRFKGPELHIPNDSTCFTFTVNKQTWPGYYLGNGVYSVRYSPKQAETGSYSTTSTIAELNGQSGKYVSVAPWPGKPCKDDYRLGKNWYGDRPDPALFLDGQQGARTISKHREAFLMDWAKRWEWLQ